MRDDDNPPDLSPPPMATVPPDGKVTLQLALTLLMGFIVLLGVVREFVGTKQNPATDHLLIGAAGAIAGLLTGGYGKHTR